MMVYIGLGTLKNGFEIIGKQSICGYKRHLCVSRKHAEIIQSNDDLTNQESKPNFGDIKSNSALTKPVANLAKPGKDVNVLVEDEMKNFFKDIQTELRSHTMNFDLQTMSCYYVDGKGKAIRPIMATLMGKSLNFHISNGSKALLNPCQKLVAMIVEMLHSVSLMHDDILDGEKTRRGNPSMASMNHKEVTTAGYFVIGAIISMIERVKNYDARMLMYRMSRDLALGEFLQLETLKTVDEDMFSRYLHVIHLKAAVLFASACEAQAILAGGDFFLREGAFQYGRNIGLAFQLADDFKDFEYDLSQGLATAPVLLACKKYRELEEIVLRRFSEKGDLDKAFAFVKRAQGLEETKKLVNRFCNEALRHASIIQTSPYQDALEHISDKIRQVTC